MKNHLLNKLKTVKGESFAEVLISILVMSFALLTLATMITASWKLVQNSLLEEEQRQLSITEMDNAVASGSSSADCSLKFTTDESGTTKVKINGADGNYTAADLLKAKYYKTGTGSETLLSFWPVPDPASP